MKRVLESVIIINNHIWRLNTMKKSLLTLTLLVGFAPVVIAKGGKKATVKPAEKVIADVNTDANTTEDSTDENSADSEEKDNEDVPAWKRGYNWTKGHLSNNKKRYFGGASVLALGGLGYAGYNNPRTVRRFGKIARRGLRVALKAALANPWRTAVVVGVPTGALALWKREAVSTGWNKFSTGCQNKWNGLKGYFTKADSADEESTEDSVTEDAAPKAVKSTEAK